MTNQTLPVKSGDNGTETKLADVLPHFVREQGPTFRDPNGLNQHQKGAKLDAGKDRTALVLKAFAPALQEVVQVGTFGAKKYSPNGWLAVPDGLNRYEDAFWRHLLADAQGEVVDPETGLDHLAHAAWNILAIISLKKGTKSCS